MKTKGILHPISLLAIVLISAGAFAQEASDQPAEPASDEEQDRMRITIQVIDEDDQPVPNSSVSVEVQNLAHAYGTFEGKTDVGGKFIAEGMGNFLALIEVKKEGYYRSDEKVLSYDEIGKQMRKNSPNRPVDRYVRVKIRKIVNPIPMRVWIRVGEGEYWHFIPDVGKEFGFDLFEKDWVRPHGKGKNPDLMISAKGEFHDLENYQSECFIRFNNPHDGLIPLREVISTQSELRFPRVAPEEGYDLKKLHLIEKAGIMGARQVSEDGDAIDEPIGYLVRYRTEIDPETGEITYAMYGKITEPLERDENPIMYHTMDWKENQPILGPTFRFKLYLNPTPNDRNLEYDKVTNLAPNAPGGTWPP